MPPRTIPLTGTDKQRRLTYAAGKLLQNEFHTTKEGRAFLDIALGDVHIGPVMLGVAAGATAMLELNETHARGCWPGDTCFRFDTRTVWECITGNGDGEEDWEEHNSETSYIWGGRFDSSIHEISQYGGSFDAPPDDFLLCDTFIQEIAGGNFI